MTNKCNIEFDSMSEFIKFCKEKRESQEETQNIYFRGENINCEYRLPGLYRTMDSEKWRYPKLIENTKEYYLDLFNELGWKHNEDIFLKLTNIQHYGGVTNILDITSNPLVALFFACLEGNTDKDNKDDGKIYILCSNNKEIEKYYSDDVIELNTILNFIDKSKVNRFLGIFDYLKSKIPEDSSQAKIFSKTLSLEEFFSKFRTNLSTQITQANIESFGEKLFKEAFKKLNIANMDNKIAITVSETEAKEQIVDFLTMFFENNNYVNYLKDQVSHPTLDLKHYQTYFLDILEKEFSDFLQLLDNFVKDKFKYPYAIYESLTKSYIIKTIKINERIKNQQGYFIIPGYVPTQGKEVSRIQETINTNITNTIKDIATITIPSDKKQSILKELSYLGIDAKFIFPEINNIVKSISQKYENNS